MTAMDKARGVYDDARERVEEFSDGGSDTENRAPHGTQDNTGSSAEVHGQRYPEGERDVTGHGADETAATAERDGLGYAGTQGNADFS